MVASPFVARLWTRIAGPAAPVIRTEDSPWFKPRWDLPPVAPDELPGAPKHPTVVLLTIDALRSDVVEGPTASKKSVPHRLDMARHSLTFRHVWSAAAYTMPSLRGLFLGTCYLQHQGWRAAKVRKKAGQVKRVPKTPYLAKLLVPFMGGADPKFDRPLAADGGRAIRAMLFEDRWKAIVDHPFDRSKSKAPKGKLNPRVAASDPEQLKEAIEQDRVFLQQHRTNRLLWQQSLEHCMPPGTFWLRYHSSAVCAPFDPG